ncbi:Asparagine synthetase [glutamine-hydrolyzing] [hydrothermal vent metagenome]|uniref:Asparagine synthetase [glutamine-hydrolyzing] n=1 Tax=hydrothermal vent metagenome TaxID=652676 RepID=A0A3B1AU04_9ZZZZ
MCGIVGFFSTEIINDVSDVGARMVKKLHHRGPDDSGVWTKKEHGIVLGHARLSIQDLSSAGHQPMLSHCGRYTIIFNGEIYNHLSIRKDLDKTGDAANWRGHSDTETLLSAFTAWGVEKTLQQCSGMFALAIWDCNKKELILARDRLGEKPLYYGWQGDTFLFGSELKALRVHPAFLGEINRNSICLLLRHNVISAPYSIYHDIYKLEPGSMLVLKYGERKPTITPYWSIREIVQSGCKKPFSGNVNDAILKLEGVMSRSVQEQMISDVPLGAFLSGGVDSSIIVALMQTQSTLPVNTFSIGFNEKYYNEAVHAKDVAEYLGTNHTELYLDTNDLLDVIPKLPSIYDEPFADSSQLPTYLVSSMAKQHVTVALTGDGGDELFGGYNRHFLAKKIWNKIKFLPLTTRNIISRAMMLISPQGWNLLYKVISSILPARAHFNLPEDKIRKLADILSVDTPEAMYMNLVSHWKKPDDLVHDAINTSTVLNDTSKWAELSDIGQQMMYLDTVSYLPDDILTKVDRAAMSVSLETRVPMLDHRVVEFAWKLPLDMKIRNGEGKWLLKQLLYKYVPKTLIDRPKMGFGVPIDSWLRGPLKDWAESLLNESRLRHEGYFEPAPIRAKWEEHLSGKRNWQYHLWDVLMFQQWLESQ